MAKPPRTPWQPLLSGTSAAEGWEVVESIAGSLRGVSSANDDPSLAAGAAGRALFFAYRAAASGDRREESLAERELDRAIAAIAERPMSPDLFGGFTGVAFAFEHLQGRRPELADDEANEPVDDALGQLLGRSRWAGDFDLVSGLAGHGVYALERLQHPSGAANLGRVVARLAELSEPRPPGVTWRSRPEFLPPAERDLFPRGHFNLGVAHGVPAVAAILAGACAADVSAAIARPLLDRTMDWLWANQAQEHAASGFPCWVSEDAPPKPARAAWCYGDPGVAATLYAASRAVGSADWERRALELGRAAATRAVEQSGVRDAGLCHGAAGLLHLYNRLWQGSQDEVFANAARHWVSTTLSMRRPLHGVAGYQAWSRGAEGNEPTWRDDRSLLTGVVGIGLALLAAISPVEPEWDRMLLASLPRGAS